MPVVIGTGLKTLGDMKARIADELARADLVSQIADAITDAVDEAATYRFWFNEVRGLVFTTTPGVSDYPSDDISALTEIDLIWINVGGQRINLRQANDFEIDGFRTGSPVSGQPWMWSMYGGAIRLYPTPQQSYAVSIDGATKFPPLSDDTDTNPWMNEGERYVRALAKRDLLMNVVKDFEEAQAQDAVAQRMRDQLLARTSDKLATGTLRAWC